MCKAKWRAQVAGARTDLRALQRLCARASEKHGDVGISVSAGREQVVVVENLTLSGRHLFPNVVENEAHNLVRFSPYAAKAAGDASTHEFTFTFSEVHADVRRGVLVPLEGGADQDGRLGAGGRGAWRVGARLVLPRIWDVADGWVQATATLKSSRETHRASTVLGVRVKVGQLRFRIRDSKHHLLYT
ncbi:hypothetical protein B0H15DRAFT_27799 [Mycena belliarum]|uniref:HAM1-like N-terminal domain-containing protein n=1 Tax=Mycena belliarum TaxID=1033014 RepID=A0AAD6UJ66_9AGAR|nr:hypothetical protein B0H15DRAFT_27799 [Mycena belliae]